MAGDQLELTLFDPDDSGDVPFDRLAKTNGKRTWSARLVLMPALGYDNWALFQKSVINRAIGACMSLNIRVDENFLQGTVRHDGKDVDDYQLTRFACCLVAMNGDPRKNLKIAAAQAYFASLALLLRDVALDPESVDRLVIRGEISEREVTLAKTAEASGVDNFGMFQNAGYRGMYNMNLSELKRLKHLPDVKRSLLDFMGKDELAGNLFRLTLTEGRMKKEQIRGQKSAEYAAESVGRRVRAMMIEETGVAPEQLGPDSGAFGGKTSISLGIKDYRFRGFGRHSPVVPL